MIQSGCSTAASLHSACVEKIQQQSRTHEIKMITMLQSFITELSKSQDQSASTAEVEPWMIDNVSESWSICRLVRQTSRDEISTLWIDEAQQQNKIRLIQQFGTFWNFNSL